MIILGETRRADHSMDAVARAPAQVVPGGGGLGEVNDNLGPGAGHRGAIAADDHAGHVDAGDGPDVEAFVERIDRGGVWAANFAIGAVLMMYFARVAARFMDAAEVIELHHSGKVDAPSGTAVQTAQSIRSSRDADLPDPQVERWTLEGARGAVSGGVRIHSVRLPGLNAHQEVLFGALGQVLSIRHDALGRDAYVPGVALAVQHVSERVGLTRGLDTLMGLS